MRADDDGFVSSPKKITKIINSAEDDMKVLIAKKFIIPFESGICVIRHWRIHNLIRQDRYTETEYKKEKELLIQEDNKYFLNNGKQKDIPNGNQMAAQVRLGKVRKDKVRERESTPEQDFLNFLNSSEQKKINLLEEKLKRNLTAGEKSEVAYFISYWTEETKNGKKQKWQLQQTFNFVRRIETWFRNTDKFGDNKDKPLIIK